MWKGMQGKESSILQTKYLKFVCLVDEWMNELIN